MGTIIEIPLCPQAVSDINTAAGGTFAVGIHLETYSGGVVDEAVRISSASEARTHQLTLTSYEDLYLLGATGANALFPAFVPGSDPSSSGAFVMNLNSYLTGQTG